MLALLNDPVATNAAVKPMAPRTRLLLEGPVVSTLLRLAAPNFVVNVVLIAVTASVDAHFVGKIDTNAIAGLALVFPLLMLMQQVANSSMGGAIASAIARAIGAGRIEEAQALVIHGLIIACCMAALFSMLVLAAGPSFYAFMGGDGAILAAAVEYSNAIFAGALAYWLLSTLTSVVRATGQVGLLAVVTWPPSSCISHWCQSLCSAQVRSRRSESPGQGLRRWLPFPSRPRFWRGISLRGEPCSSSHLAAPGLNGV